MLLDSPRDESMYTNLQATATFARKSCPRLPSVSGLVVRKPLPPVQFVKMPPLLPTAAVRVRWMMDWESRGKG